jgi:hypothetical protein
VDFVDGVTQALLHEKVGVGGVDPHIVNHLL